MLGLVDPVDVLRHRWAEIVEGGDIISRLVRDFGRLSADINSAEQLSAFYPGA